MLDQFRQMVNACIQIGLADNVSSLRALSLKAYGQLAEYNVMSYYKLGAISAAAGILRNYRKLARRVGKARNPQIHRLHLTTCYGFEIQDGQLLLPHRPREPIKIPLTPHVQATIRGYEVRSVTLTQDRLCLAYAKQVVELKPGGLVAVDRNLDNVTLAAAGGIVAKHNLAEASRVKASYRELRSHMRRNDVRIRNEIYRKYGSKEREKVKQILHHASKMIVLQAKEQRFGIVMEQLKGVRRLYKKANGQGRRYRGRMNSWSYFELQRQIEYKARWEGLPVFYVKPHGTSAKCSICGSRMARIPEENRTLKCTACGVTVDRDVNAARNILARGLRFGPVASAGEAMVAVKRRPVDAGELIDQHALTG